MSCSACFAGRTELLDWLNTLCATELTKLEQTCTGAVACQVLDALFPGKVPMAKVDWGATHDYEFIGNYKLLQQSFFVLRIDKQIPVDRLVRGKYQDNLEFMQWLKAFYDRQDAHPPYDPIARREKGKGGAEYNRKLCGSMAAKVVAAQQSTTVKSKSATPTKKSPRRTSSSGRGACAPISEDAAMALKEMVKNVTEANESLSKQNERLRSTVAIVEKDRDFYLKKLEAVEDLVNESELSETADHETTLLSMAILEVLYATQDDE